jgi:membrane protein required for colicin V production
VNWLDILLLIVMIVCIVEGLKQGLVKTAIGLAAVVLGFFCALWFYASAGSLLSPYFTSQQIANLLGFLLVFLGVIAIGALLIWIIERFLKILHLTWLNRLLGGAFGFVRGLLTGAILVLAAMAFAPKPGPLSVANSRLAPYVIDTARVLVAAAPREVKDAYQNSYDRIKQVWADTLKHSFHKQPEKETQ